MNATTSIRTDGWEQVVFVESDVGVFELFTVASEENGAGTRSVADPEDVTFCQRGTVGLGSEGVRMGFEPV